MRNVKEIIKNKLVILLLIELLFGVMMIGCLIITSNKYEETLAYLQEENKKLEYKNKRLMHNIELLQTDKDCDCEWYEAFYYEHAEEFGAFE